MSKVVVTALCPEWRWGSSQLSPNRRVGSPFLAALLAVVFCSIAWPSLASARPDHARMGSARSDQLGTVQPTDQDEAAERRHNRREQRELARQQRREKRASASTRLPQSAQPDKADKSALTAKPRKNWQRFVPASDTVAEADLWQRVRAGFSMDLDAVCDAEVVAPLLRRYEERTGVYLERILARANPYLHHIVERLEERGMPLELAVLPVVESAYDPFAYSPGKAAGLWQFISHTAALFGMHSDWWIEGRNDIRASTDAALSYLSKLHTQNKGDWLLAMASYNAGLGAVRRAVSYVRAENKVLWRRAQQRVKDGQRQLRKAEARARAATRLSETAQQQLQVAQVQLEYLRAEFVALIDAADIGQTEIEVIRPVAAGEVMAVVVLSTGADGMHSAEQAVTEAAAQLAVASVSVRRTLDKVAQADERLLLVRANLERQNAAVDLAKAKFERWPTFGELRKLPQETRSYIPKFCAIAQIVATPARYGITIAPVPDLPYFSEVDIGAQLDLALAAELAGVNIEVIYRLNPSMRRWATPPDGPHRLLVPVAQRALMESNLAQLAPKHRLRWINHQLRKGEGLNSIARHYHTTVEAIQRINSLPDGASLRLGDQLLVMAPLYALDRYVLSEGQQRMSQTALRSTAKKRPVQQRFHHVVRDGESLWSISRQYGIGSYDQIAIWNRLDSNAPLPMGTRLSLWIPPNNTTQRGNAVATVVGDRDYERVTYKVRSGDSLSGIAQRFGVDIRQIAQWNSIDVHQYIQPQQILVLYPATR